MKNDIRKIYEEIGVVSNAPVNDKSKGYAFIDLDGGGVVYCPAPLVTATKLNGEHIGSQARVRYQQMSNGKLVALRVYVINDAGGPDQVIADAIVKIDGLIDQIDDHMVLIFDLLEERGCAVPERG